MAKSKRLHEEEQIKDAVQPTEAAVEKAQRIEKMVLVNVTLFQQALDYMRNSISKTHTVSEAAQLIESLSQCGAVDVKFNDNGK
jgi:hypothetical protein